MQRIRLIWDFRGPNAKPIAEHHCRHLTDFINAEELQRSFSFVETVSDMHHMAILVVEEDRVEALRETLKPHRGQLHTE